MRFSGHIGFWGIGWEILWLWDMKGCPALATMRGCLAFVAMSGCPAFMAMSGSPAFVAMSGCPALFDENKEQSG